MPNDDDVVKAAMAYIDEQGLPLTAVGLAAGLGFIFDRIGEQAQHKTNPLNDPPVILKEQTMTTSFPSSNIGATPHDKPAPPPKTIYAVVYTESVFIPGDERSRTNPGHGYPETTNHYEVFQEFDTEEKWLAWIKKEMKPSYGSPRKFRAFRCVQASVTTEVSVNIG